MFAYNQPSVLVELFFNALEGIHLVIFSVNNFLDLHCCMLIIKLLRGQKDLIT